MWYFFILNFCILIFYKNNYIVIKKVILVFFLGRSYSSEIILWLIFKFLIYKVFYYYNIRDLDLIIIFGFLFLVKEVSSEFEESLGEIFVYLKGNFFEFLMRCDDRFI